MTIDPEFNYKFKNDPRFIDRTVSYRSDDRDYLHPNVREWLDETCKEPWFYCSISQYLFFDSQTDGALFRLTWL